MVKKARRMAGEFQTHVDEMVQATPTSSDVRDQISQTPVDLDITRHHRARRRFGDGSIRRTRATTTRSPPATVTPPAPAATDPPPVGEVPGASFADARRIGLGPKRSEPPDPNAPEPTAAEPNVAPSTPRWRPRRLPRPRPPSSRRR